MANLHYGRLLAVQGSVVLKANDVVITKNEETGKIDMVRIVQRINGYSFILEKVLDKYTLPVLFLTEYTRINVSAMLKTNDIKMLAIPHCTLLIKRVGMTIIGSTNCTNLDSIVSLMP